MVDAINVKYQPYNHMFSVMLDDLKVYTIYIYNSYIGLHLQRVSMIYIYGRDDIYTGLCACM